LRLAEAAMRIHPMPRRPPPAPANQVSYLAQAEACLAQAAVAPDATARALHQQECSLWLMLARQSKAIDDVVEDYLSETDA
jgi:hypothetical protein